MVTTSIQLTYSGVLLAVFANQLCLPVPSIIVLMAAGALSAHGKMSTGILVLLGVLGCLAADGIWFGFGRRWGSKVAHLLCRFSADPRSCSTRAHEQFRRYGLPILCVAKFVPGLDGLMPPLSGAEGASAVAFLAFDAVGGFLWSGFYVGLGYLFSNELDLAIGWVQHFGTAVAIVIGIPISVYAGWRGLILLRMMSQLRLRRISPRMLARKLKSNSKVAVLDLSNFEDGPDNQTPAAIPGAFPVDPSMVWKSPHVIVPDDVQIVLYSSSGRDIVSARAAVALKRIGVNKTWVLVGGLKAWREQGFPISQTREAPEIVAARFGVKLPLRSSASRAPLTSKIGA